MPLIRFELKAVLLIFIAIIAINISCKKKGADKSSSSTKAILSFKFLQADNPTLPYDVIAKISADTIRVNLPGGYTERLLVPTIIHTGISIKPDSKIIQDFTQPVKYTVTAEDGSTFSNFIAVRSIGITNEITSYILKKENNPGLTEDIVGDIYGDTIALTLPVNVSVDNIFPTIIHNGINITPNVNQAQNFNNQVEYEVTAENMVKRKYVVSAVANKMVYVGTEDGKFYALDARSGRMVWMKNFQVAVRATPTLYNGHLYIGDFNGILHCLDPLTGETIWTSSIGSPIKSSALGYNGVVVTSDYYQVSWYTGPGVHAVDELTGIPVWHFPAEIVSDPAMYNGVVYFSKPLHNLTALNMRTGAEVWVMVGYGGRGNPAIADGKLFTDCEIYDIMCMDALTGHLIWTYNHPEYRPSFAPTVNNNRLFADCGPTLLSFNASTGTINWEFASERGSFSAPALMNETVFVSNATGVIYAVDAGTGSIKWKSAEYDQYGGAKTQLVAANNTVYYGGFDNSIKAINGTTGRLIWKFSTPAPSIGGLLVIGSDNKATGTGLSGEQQ